MSRTSKILLSMAASVAVLCGCSGKNVAGDGEIPMIEVGIMTADSVSIVERDSLGRTLTTYTTTPCDVIDSLVIRRMAEGNTLEVEDVTIGVGFHWQQKEPQRFEGEIKILNDGGHLVVVNHIDLESYLESVISSEMSADCPQSLLEAHAIVSRSWLLSQITRKHTRESRHERDSEIVVWYDRDDHDLFDVCADDHCQRYQGVTRRTKPEVVEAVHNTRGQVLMVGDTVCDARFSKCCGGLTELFESCWEPVHHSYLESLYDGPADKAPRPLNGEADAEQWILSRPDSYCAHPSTELLATVLNSYDRATTDYYRWHAGYDADSLGRLVARRSGHDLGRIVDLKPLHRGPSGRITRLMIAGDRDTLIVGKELEIRRVLSPSHLYSSAFVARVEGDSVMIDGAGWGHGVGLCQIGAAVMAAEGHSAADIVAHYYPGATTVKIYN